MFCLIWLLVSVLTRKFHIKSYKSYIDGVYLHIKSIVFILYCLSFLIVFLGLSTYSRIQIFGTCLIMLVLDILLFSIFYLGINIDRVEEENGNREYSYKKIHISSFLLVSDFILLTLAFFTLNYFKRGDFNLSPDYERAILVIYAIWLGSSIITQKFDMHNFQNYYHAIAACVKSIFLMGFSMSVVIYAFRLFFFSRLQIFGTLLLFILFEALFLYLYFVLKYGSDLNGDIESVDEVYNFLEQQELAIEKQQRQLVHKEVSFMKILFEKYLKSVPRIHDFITQTIDLSSFEDSDILIVNSPDIADIQILDSSSTNLFMNLYRLNDVRWINRYFLEIHKNLRNGGYFIGRATIIKTHKANFFKKYPKYFAEILYIFNFVFYRIFPKLPHLRKIYFSITKGKNRHISRAEVLGRLYFCGFEVLAEKEINESLIFIARKVKTSSLDQNPSYSPIIKLKRSGLNGQMIYVYKFRTMYPYSEYLQDYIYQRQKLDEGGKIKDDFRVTDWGIVMRKYWIDELPMFLNWIKGDIKLFGLRPLSSQYLSLYDSSLQKIRRRLKPGLIPPYYADLPRELEEINESENRYIQSYFKNPFKTQFIYFFKVINNIVFKGARSN